MIKHILLSLTLLCTLVAPVWAENALDPQAIEAIEATYRAFTDLTADFTQTTDVALVGKTVTKRGVFQFKKGGKLRIEYQGKDAKHYVSDGSTIWTYIPGDDGSLQTYAVNDKNVPKEALSFLNGFGKLSKEFQVSPSTAFPDATKGDTALHLTPLKKGTHYESLDTLFGPNHMLVELVVKNTSGNLTRYRFTNIRKDTGLDDARFTLSTGKATPDTLPQ